MAWVEWGYCPRCGDGEFIMVDGVVEMCDDCVDECFDCEGSGGWMSGGDNADVEVCFRCGGSGKVK